MPQFSTAPTIKQTLVSAITARPALTGVQVTYGFILRGLRTESVALGRIDWESELWAATGNKRKEENYWIELWVWVQRKGFTQKQSTERAFAILADIEVFLREDPLLGGLVNLVSIEPVSVAEAPANEGYQTMAEARIHVKARK